MSGTFAADEFLIPVTHCLSEERSEFDPAFVESLVADLHGTLGQQFPDVAEAEREAVGQPDWVLNGAIAGKRPGVFKGVRSGQDEVAVQSGPVSLLQPGDGNTPDRTVN